MSLIHPPIAQRAVLIVSLLIAMGVGSHVSSNDATTDEKKASLLQKIGQLSSSVKQRLGRTFGRDDQHEAPAAGQPYSAVLPQCGCHDVRGCRHQLGNPSQPNAMARPPSMAHSAAMARPAAMARRDALAHPATFSRRSLPNNIPPQTAHHPTAEQSPHVASTTVATQRELGREPFQHPEDQRMEHPTENRRQADVADFRQLLRGDAERTQRAVYQNDLVPSGSNASSDSIQHYLGHWDRQSNGDALPNAPQSAPATIGVPPARRPDQLGYEGIQLSAPRVTATEHALWYKQQNEMLTAKQQGLAAENQRLRESLQTTRDLLARSEQAMSRAKVQLELAEIKNAELQESIAARDREHQRFVRETDRMLNTIRDELDEVLVGEINANQ